jgi:hypothetical protein
MRKRLRQDYDWSRRTRHEYQNGLALGNHQAREILSEVAAPALVGEDFTVIGYRILH